MNTADYLEQNAPDILGAIRQNLGAKDASDTSCDRRINAMTTRALFDSLLEWHGMSGWGGFIIGAWNTISAANGDPA